MFASTDSEKKMSDLKRVLPKGTCLVSEVKKYEYIKKFMAHSQAYMYVIPMLAEFSIFVVIRTQPLKGNPIFKLYFHPTKRFLLSAQQQSLSIGCNYLISCAEIPSKGDKFVGKLRGNFKGDQFQLYDKGDNPERVKTRPRKHLSYIKWEESSGFTSQKCMGMTMIVPKPEENISTHEGIHQFSPLGMECRQSNPNPLTTEPKNSDYIQVLQLKKQYRSMGSLNNMVVQSTVKTQSVVVNQKSSTFFELKIGCPLTVLQGFGFLLSAIEHLSL